MFDHRQQQNELKHFWLQLHSVGQQGAQDNSLTHMMLYAKISHNVNLSILLSWEVSQFLQKN